jgi:hypothetical protein
MKKQNRKGRQFNLVVPPAELKHWRKRAEESEMKLSEWIRKALSEAPVYQKTVEKRPEP